MKSIIVNVMPEETRIAVKENNRLTSLELERPRHSHLVGNIYKGIVQNVLPGMQAAFVDIGQSKNAFLFLAYGVLLCPTEQHGNDPFLVGGVGIAR